MSRKHRKGKPRVPKQPHKNDRDFWRFTDIYRAEHPGKKFCLEDLAAWMIDTGKWEPEEAIAVKELMRRLRRSLQRAKILDPDGNSSRKYHSIPTDTQLRMWDSAEEISTEDLRLSLQDRVNSLFGGVKSINADANYHNNFRKPAKKIQLTFDFDARLEAEKHSSEYIDQPPESDE